ncbi:hypothetical protein [Halomonas stenophila]|uniref:DNA-binding phage protein n=1 Tax=Halomonas stenophila TaxID=795312 RepID=A0A7W5ET02_9GAMM|nr:hypothetical protein [Halomonas stenophila]MBB3230957.1 DNA-binding phage protein [Halomonas stenophila]
MAANIEAKTNVSPTLHPFNITRIEGYEEARGYVSHAVTALDEAYQSVDAVHEARKKLQLDESRTNRAKVLMTAQLAEKYSARLQKTFESSWNKLNAAIQHTERELTQPVEEFAGIGNVATEIRAHVKNMSQGDRMNFLSEALKRGDQRTLKSVLGAPSYLSGMTGVEHEHFTRRYHSHQSPELSSRIEVMKATLDKLERAHPIFVKELEKAVGASRSDVERLQAASNEAEAALVMKEFAPQE